MNKKELVNLIAEKMELTKKDAEGILSDMDAVMELVAENIQVDQKIKVGAYVQVEKVNKPARVAKNPMTGADVEVPAKDVLKVKATSTFKKLA